MGKRHHRCAWCKKAIFDYQGITAWNGKTYHPDCFDENEDEILWKTSFYFIGRETNDRR